MLTAKLISLLNLDPARYRPSYLHDSSRAFRESNCYVDIWIELLHALDLDPASALAFTCAIDFEGDQWTFFKPPADDLRSLFGIDVHEMQIYRPLVDHISEQIDNGRTVIVEVDSFYLPDTASTSYRKSHVKSSIAVEAIDPEDERLRYFHGAGYYELQGEDFRGVFRLGRKFSDDVLPPYIELVRFDAGERLEGSALRSKARELLQRHLAQRPRANPYLKFGDRLTADLPGLLRGTEATYHAYAFATLRQCGAAFELASNFVEWLADPANASAHAAREAINRQVATVKGLVFRLARRRPFDPGPQIRQLAEDWDVAIGELQHLCLTS
jgi:Domain of unknown function (DUF1839)